VFASIDATVRQKNRTQLKQNANTTAKTATANQNKQQNTTAKTATANQNKQQNTKSYTTQNIQQNHQLNETNQNNIHNITAHNNQPTPTKF
jgi:hypothetical protein